MCTSYQERVVWLFPQCVRNSSSLVRLGYNIQMLVSFWEWSRLSCSHKLKVALFLKNLKTLNSQKRVSFSEMLVPTWKRSRDMLWVAGRNLEYMLCPTASLGAFSPLLQTLDAWGGASAWSGCLLPQMSRFLLGFPHCCFMNSLHLGSTQRNEGQVPSCSVCPFVSSVFVSLC